MNKLSKLVPLLSLLLAILSIAALVCSIISIGTPDIPKTQENVIKYLRAKADTFITKEIAKREITKYSFESNALGADAARVKISFSCKKNLADSEVTVYAEPRYHQLYTACYKKSVAISANGKDFEAEFDLSFEENDAFGNPSPTFPYYFSIYARSADGSVQKLTGVDIMLTKEEALNTSQTIYEREN